ncbi:DNA/RNA-binding domain of Phe-tRNA-synthetase-like protein [Dysgonomonas sp. PH5-45]|uniref:B3/B4 domain-containing protein n=1 Tax=unclassified Dysgonomonas TaxID=2630389 RepID=UPI0024745BA4|nr:MULTISPECIES: phenylalanine--tRNA ligase beta subunit-related protein [unclassified Dysgonomonas]MDH6355409.1 DNA/RNA-binding domain of Phe-tRNA-synthetase-like protein [Dysgonomonas sp. PH5-45]MDH6388306.1 DNA/RNA-binding domain of Phe-tRNA-synthetase-like protein [Dysgonomonas sp. PH5-37]
MISINVSGEFKSLCPDFAGAAILAKVVNTPYCEPLWREINSISEQYKQTGVIEEIKKHPAIEATRMAYKRFGKDPNRYRPSAEALCRRILRDIPLYQIDTLVDIINLVSIKTGYSIGGFDVDKISGNVLTLGVGTTGEPYEGIGKGLLNIEGLPVYRDKVGGIGTPTSDNERTKISVETKYLLAIINGYDGPEGLPGAVQYMQSLLQQYASSDGGDVFYF